MFADSLSGPRRVALVLAALVAFIGGGAVVVAFSEEVHQSFAWHMVQHEVIMFVIAPAAVVLAGQIPWGWLPPILKRLAWFLSRATVALPVATVTLWLWHLPSLYDAALHSDVLHLFEHGTFLVAFMLFWWPLMPRTSPLVIQTNFGRVIYLSLGAMQGAVLGALLAFADSPAYSFYIQESQSPLTDQQAAGAIMWFVGPIFFGIAALIALRGRSIQPAMVS